MFTHKHDASVVQDALKRLSGYEELPTLLGIRLMNISAPLVPFGYPMLGHVAQGNVGGISQADAQEALLLGLLLGVRGAVSGILIHLRSDEQLWLDAGLPPSFAQANFVPVNATKDIQVTIMITQDNR